MPRNRDLFDDTTMTFGEHLEVLRVHVWRALIGLIIGVVISLFCGNIVVGILREPIDAALRRNNIEAKDDISGFDLWAYLTDDKAVQDGENEPEQEEPEAPLAPDELRVQVSADEVVELIRKIDPDAEVGAEGVQADDSKKDALEITIKSPDIQILRDAADRYNHPVTYKVEEAFMTYLKVSMVSGLILSSPWIFFQVWQFVAAGLYPHERKYISIYLPMSIILFLSGALFCFYFVFPIVLDFLISFNKWLGVVLQPRLSEYISLVIMLPVMFGISFQLPLVMLFIERIGVITVEGYKENWRMAVLVISIASMLLTPSDPTSMLMMMFPLIFLYFGGILLCRFRPGEKVDPLA